jgi:hypothetical protein
MNELGPAHADARLGLPEPRRLEQFIDIVTFVQLVERQQLEQDRAERVHVGSTVHRVGIEALLRSEMPRRSERGRAAGKVQAMNLIRLS